MRRNFSVSLLFQLWEDRIITIPIKQSRREASLIVSDIHIQTHDDSHVFELSGLSDSPDSHATWMQHEAVTAGSTGPPSLLLCVSRFQAQIFVFCCFSSVFFWTGSSPRSDRSGAQTGPVQALTSDFRLLGCFRLTFGWKWDARLCRNTDASWDTW